MFLFEGIQNLNDITKNECLENAKTNNLYKNTSDILANRDLDLKELSAFADFEKRVILLIAIMSVESRCKRRVVNNNTNATGIMQLTPICVKEIKNKANFSVNATNVKSSIEGGIIYINLCYNYFKNKQGLKKNWSTWTDMQKLNVIMHAYNAGPYGIINKISADGYDPSSVGYAEDIETMMDFFEIKENLENLKSVTTSESKLYLYHNRLVTETFLRNMIRKNLLK